MASNGKFLHRIRQSASSFPCVSPILLRGKLTPLRSWKAKQLLLWKPNLLGRLARGVHWSGRELGAMRTGRLLFGVSFLVGSVGFSRRFVYAMDDFSGADEDFMDSSDEDQNLPPLWLFVRKFWLPASFFLTMLLNWDHPIILAYKAVLFLITTKPSPLSIYVFVEKLCQQSMHQQPYMYLLKPLYANKVEVQDYKLLCLAKVELRHQKLNLVGILGGWWVLPLSWEAFAIFWDSSLY